LTPSLQGRVALITGASRGLGAACAIELARRGARVVLLARMEGALSEVDDQVREAGGEAATLLPLDLANGDALDSVGPSIYARFGRLDILVHAAAFLGRLTPAPHIQPRDWEAALAANLSAAWRLMRTCGPLLEAGDAGRAVFVTCERAAVPRAYWGAFGATRAGMEHLALTWAAETTGRALRVNLFEAPPMRTRFRAFAYPGEDPAAQPPPERFAAQVTDLCEPSEARHGERVRASVPEEAA
jgi:NAD(P)-dependent dehydrogenase (short-subunit alcohol dehydrogenase family)